MSQTRRYPVGAEVMPDGGTHFRVWAPRCSTVAVILEHSGEQPVVVDLKSETEGYFSGLVGQAKAGTLYRFRLDGDNSLYPDPVSRFQPQGPHGPSQVVDPAAFSWSDHTWPGVPREGQVIYEMHIGTFTPEGSWDAAIRELPPLAELGITLLEVMPVADFSGTFGWGYDGVNEFAPTRLYGPPDGFRRFVDRAHALGMGVILDVVYNHLGPDGNYLKQFADEYFTDRYDNEWGDAINFDGFGAGPVREFFLTNAAYWIEEYHLDGLRIDATQQIFDAGKPHILAEISARIRSAAKGRSAYIVAENEPQDTHLVRPVDQGGYGIDSLWNDDFHHSALVALKGHNDAYYTDYLGKPQEFISAAKWGYLYQGQRYSWQKKRRGTPALDLTPSNFVTFLENHDQVANTGRGLRVRQLTSPGRYRAMTALLLLGPGTPMLFQGQEFGSTRPFYYFADHGSKLSKMVREGRAKFLSQFPSLAAADTLAHVADPGSRDTFELCKLSSDERRTNQEWLALHRDLLKLRRDDPAFRTRDRRGVDGAVLGSDVFVLRFFVQGNEDRLLLVNIGRDLLLHEAPEPLLAPPAGKSWTVRWSCDDWAYGGSGYVAPENDEGVWRIAGESAIVLIPGEA